jgi:hypothetical protein
MIVRDLQAIKKVYFQDYSMLLHNPMANSYVCTGQFIKERE